MLNGSILNLISTTFTFLNLAVLSCLDMRLLFIWSTVRKRLCNFWEKRGYLLTVLKLCFWLSLRLLLLSGFSNCSSTLHGLLWSQQDKFTKSWKLECWIFSKFLKKWYVKDVVWGLLVIMFKSTTGKWIWYIESRVWIQA